MTPATSPSKKRVFCKDASHEKGMVGGKSRCLTCKKRYEQNVVAKRRVAQSFSLAEVVVFNTMLSALLRGEMPTLEQLRRPAMLNLARKFMHAEDQLNKKLGG